MAGMSNEEHEIWESMYKKLKEEVDEIKKVCKDLNVKSDRAMVMLKRFADKLLDD